MVHNSHVMNHERNLQMATATTLPVNITIHGLDAELAAAFRDFADKTKTSLNAAAKELLRRALGLPTADEEMRIDEWNRFFRSVPKGDPSEWLKTLEPFEQIDEETWK